MRAFVVAIALLAVIGASGWYVWKEKPDALKGVVPASEAAGGEDSAGPVKPTEAQVAQWRQDMKAGCAAANEGIRIEQFDVNGDNRSDTVCWRIVKTETSDPYIDVAARVKNASGQLQTAYILVPMTGASEQFGVCGPAETLRVEQARWTKQQFEDMGWADLGRVSIAINGGDCDPPWLFWPKDAKGEEVEFDFARM